MSRQSRSVQAWLHTSNSLLENNESNCILCRNFRPLFNYDPPASESEIRAASLQFVRKITGINKPSKANEVAFLAAVDAVATASGYLPCSLETNAPPRDRAEEDTKARAPSTSRFSNNSRMLTVAQTKIGSSDG